MMKTAAWKAADGIVYTDKRLARKADAEHAIREWCDLTEFESDAAYREIQDVLVRHAAALAPLLAAYVKASAPVPDAPADPDLLDALRESAGLGKSVKDGAA